MTLRIGICDTDQFWCNHVEKILTYYGKQQKLIWSIMSFNDAESFAAYEGERLHVLFTDVKLNHTDGIEMVRGVNEKWPDCQVVYLTDHFSYMMDVYRTEHIYFILKEQFENRLAEVMDKVWQHWMHREQKLVFDVHGGEHMSLLPTEVIYFERDKRITNIYSNRGVYVTDEKISDLIERLPDVDFVRCHNSYIVYMPAIATYSRNKFLLRNGKSIVISRAYMASTEKAFRRWAGTQIP